jgi:hypothetical protein
MEMFIWGFTSLGDQDMEMRMKIDAISEGLDDVGDRPLPRQGKRFRKRARIEPTGYMPLGKPLFYL